jgi:hypothetical protein
VRTTNKLAAPLLCLCMNITSLYTHVDMWFPHHCPNIHAAPLAVCNNPTPRHVTTTHHEPSAWKT